tara:strand:- start:180 stop:479 length:300 start_codon:yes stop_codon:yes gene_type:complete
MSKFTTDLKWIRQQVERAQAVTDGQKSLGAKVVWDEQKQDYVNQIPVNFTGLVVHLSSEMSPAMGTKNSETEGIGQNEFEALKREIIESLDTPTSSSVS